MRFLTVSDEVVPAIYSLNIKERFGDIECVLGCGDLPYYYLEFIVTMLGVPCYYVYGNHDGVQHTDGGESLEAARGCVLLENRCTMHNGYLVAGLGGSIRYNDDRAPQYTESEMALRAWRLAPKLIMNKLRHGRYLDILLTHAPPLGIHNGPDRPHKGFNVFLDFMERYKPRYLIHGHIHRSYGFSAVTETRYKDTLVINTAGYRLLSVELSLSEHSHTTLDGKQVQ